MVDVKCKNCGRLLMKATIAVCAIKCHRCGKLFEYKVMSSSMELSNAHTIKTIDTNR